jgi:hypothetical protein
MIKSCTSLAPFAYQAEGARVERGADGVLQPARRAQLRDQGAAGRIDVLAMRLLRTRAWP